MVVLFPHAVCDLFAGAAALHVDHVAQEQRRDFGGDQSVVGIPSNAGELCRTADIEPVPDVLSKFGNGFCPRGGDHDADQRARGIRIVSHAVLGLGDAGNRRISDLPHPGYAAVPAAVQDVRGIRRLDRNPVDQPMVRAGRRLSDADRPVRHLDHDRLFCIDPEGTR